jgi:Right handed beta helix region
VALQKKKFGNKSLKREVQLIFSLAFLLGLLVIGIYLGINSSVLRFDTRDDAAGKTYFVENSGSLQDAINKATNSDAIFLKVGTYSTTNSEGFVIKNKNVKILGAGRDFVKIIGNNNAHVFTVTDSNVRFDSVSITGANKEGVLIQNNGKSEVFFKSVEISSNSGSAIKTDSKTTIQGAVIDQNGAGIEASSTLEIRDTLIQNSADNAVIIPAQSTGNVTIANSIIQNNKGKAVAIDGGTSITIKNVTVYKNDSGIIESGTTSVTNVSNTIVQSSKAEGISLKGANSKVTYTNAFDNKTADFSPSGLKTAEGNMSVDSGFISTTDLHLNKTSSAVKAKGVTSEKNADGTRIDLGAFGGTPNLAASNGTPVITSTPQKYIKPGETFSYEVIATDPDNDTLSYTVVNSNAPKWIKQTGNKFVGTPTANEIGFWGIVLVVSDVRGHNVVQPISINVIPANRAVPQDVPTPTPTTQPTQAPVAKVTFVTPKSGVVMSSESSDIKWTVTGGSDIEKIVLKYTDDKENFKTITTLPGDATSYQWKDVDKLTPGKYILQIEATDKAATPVTIKQMSDEFEVKAAAPTTGQAIVITKNSPADNDNVTSRKALIQVEFKPDATLDESKTFLKINGEDVTYKYTKNTVYYEPQKDLLGTKAQVEIKLVTTDGAEASKKWMFSLPIVANPQDTTPTITRTSTVLGLPRALGLLVIGIIILGLLLLILYFVIKLIKTVRDERQGNLEAEFTEYYDAPNTENQDNRTATATNTAVMYPVLEGDEQKPVTYQNDYAIAPDQGSEYYIDPNQPAPVETEVTTTQTTEYQQNPDQNQVSQTPVMTYVQDDATQSVSQLTSDQKEYTSLDLASNEQQQTQAAPVAQAQSDEYIDSLKEKYGITDDDIQSYREQESTMEPGQPDPTQASSRPQKA